MNSDNIAVEKEARLARFRVQLAAAGKKVASIFSLGNNRRTVMHHDWFVQAEIAGLDCAMDHSAFSRVDDATWRDLEIKRFSDQVSSDMSLIGRQALYLRLRRSRGTRDIGFHDALRHDYSNHRHGLIKQTAPARHSLRLIESDAMDILSGGKLSATRLLRYGKALPYAAIVASIGLSTPAWPIALALVALTIVLCAGINLKFHNEVHHQKRALRALREILGAGRDLIEVAEKLESKALEQIRVRKDDILTLNKIFAPPRIESFPGAAEYLNLVALHDVMLHVKWQQAAELNRDSIVEVTRAIGDVDLISGLLTHLDAEENQFCWAEFREDESLSFDEVGSPLLREGTPLTLSTRGRSVFLSGKNGVGKSSLLRSIGLNVITARAFGFCYAKRAALPDASVFASIKNEDNPREGLSLYMAEVKRIKEIIDDSSGFLRPIILIDEPYRGTNLLESTAAAAGVLRFFAARSTTFVTSHNMAIFAALSSSFDPMKIERPPGGAISIASGLLFDTNGIDMLCQYDYPTQIINDAQQVLEWFSGYVFHPDIEPTFPSTSPLNGGDGLLGSNLAGSGCRPGGELPEHSCHSELDILDHGS